MITSMPKYRSTAPTSNLADYVANIMLTYMHGVASRLDHANTLLYRLPSMQIHKLPS